MLLLSRITALVLLLGMASMPGAALVPQGRLSAPLAGCHGRHSGHRSEAPLPVPASLQCCVNGHHAALPSATFSSRTPLAPIADFNRESNLFVNSAGASHFAPSLLPSVRPPGLTPLRI